MDVGILAPQIGRNSGRTPIRDVAQAADELGFSSVWVTDHLIVPTTVDSSYPYRTSGDIDVNDDQPYFEMITTLGYLAGVTERVKLGTAVAILPYRNPVFLAKALSSLDQLAEGRLILGAGVGWMREEFDAVGAPFRRRGAMTDEVLEFLRAAWTGPQPVEFHGEFIQLPPAFLQPRPYQDHVPVWIGGESAAARRRIVQHGDAWFPHVYQHDPQTLAASIVQIEGELAAAGRAPLTDVGLFLPLALTERSDEPIEPWRTSRLAGDPEQIRSTLISYREAGVTHVLLMFGGRPERRIEIMSALQREGVLDI
jgi:probable F420-dependent oxidoreductase